MTQVNVLAAVVSAVAGFVFAGAFFQPFTFGPMWQGLLRTTKEERQKGNRKALIVTLLMYIVLAGAMSAVLNRIGGRTALAGVIIGGFTGAAAAANGLVTSLFRAEPFRLFVVEFVQIFLTMVLIGAIVGAWP